MAISKTKSERPAIIELIDAVNQFSNDIEGLGADLTSLGADLTAESNTRQTRDAELQSAIGIEVSNRTAADTNIQNQIGTGFSSTSTVTDAINLLQGWINRFRLGVTSSVTVEAGDSVSDTLSFGTPFADDAEVAVYLVCVDDSETLTDLSCKLVSATYSGFSFAVFNDSQADATIKVGFLAVRMN